MKAVLFFLILSLLAPAGTAAPIRLTDASLQAFFAVMDESASAEVDEPGSDSSDQETVYQNIPSLFTQFTADLATMTPDERERFQVIVARHAFPSAQDWAAIGDRLLVVTTALLCRGLLPHGELEEEIAQHLVSLDPSAKEIRLLENSERASRFRDGAQCPYQQGSAP